MNLAPPRALSTLPPLVEAIRDRVVLVDGSMGTMIYAKGVFINTCFDSLNITRPHLVKTIHLDFIQAGAEVISTNTFGAHRLKLARHGLADKVREINVAGVQLAHEASQGKCWIGAVVGPPGSDIEGDLDAVGESQLRETYREQLRWLYEAGVDAVFIQSFSHLPTLAMAVEEAKSLDPEIPVVAMALLGADHRTRFGDDGTAIGRALNAMPADLVGLNDGPGAAVLIKALQQIRAQTAKPLALEPGTGMPVRHEDLTLNLATPEYFMELLRQGIHHGARIVGGSCGANPDHIRAIKGSIRMLQPGEGDAVGVADSGGSDAARKRPDVESPSKLREKLRSGRFVVSIEIDPPVGTDATSALERAAVCRDAGIDCINIADGPRATARMGPVDMAQLLLRHAPGIEPIAHFCCRDRNLLGLQADLIGANALGIHNILVVTGDPPKLGDYPYATAVYDVDAIGALRMASRLNSGEDLAGNPLKGEPTQLFLGCGANPGAIDLSNELDRLKRKVDAGAEYILTQPVYDYSLFERFHEHASRLGAPILLGILPLASYRNAQFLNDEVPGMEVPAPILERMRLCSDKESARETGIEIAREALARAADLVQGVYIMPPFNRVESALAVLEVVRDRMEG